MTAVLYSIVFSGNTVLSENGQSQDFGPDLYVGSGSSALLNDITFSEVTGEQTDAPAGERARIAVYGESSQVFSRGAGGDGSAEGGQEVAAAVYTRGDDIATTTTTEAVPVDQLATFPSLRDPWYTDVIEVGPLLYPAERSISHTVHLLRKRGRNVGQEKRTLWLANLNAFFRGF